MTLRDLGNWVSETYTVLESDLGIVFTASPLDWPFYMILLAIPVAILAMSVIGAVLVIPIMIWQSFWEKHFDREGNALTRFGRAVDWAWDVVFLICVFFLIWIIVGVIVALIAFNGQGYQGASNAALWAVFALPTLIASGFLYFAIRGRIANTKEGSSLIETKSTSV